jgi:hypothetical protein
MPGDITAGTPDHVPSTWARRQLCRRLSPICYDSWRYVEFFTGNIRNTHTRRAYARAGARFFTWREQHESLQQKHSAPGVKQQLAAVRMLFDWLITGQVLPTIPAAAVRGAEACGETRQDAGVRGAEWRKLLNSIPAAT